MYPDVIRTILPMLEEGTVTAAADAMEKLPQGTLPELHYAALFAGCSEPDMRAGLASLKMSRAEERHIRDLWEHREPVLTGTEPIPPAGEARYALRKLAGLCGYDFCREQVLLLQALGKTDAQGAGAMLGAIESLRLEDPCCSLKQLAVNGGDLQKRNITGKAIGHTLSYLLEQVLRDALPNEKEALLAAIREE